MSPKAEAPAQSPASTQAAPEPEPTTLAEAEAMLERYRSDIDQLALNTPGSPSVAAGAAAAPADAAAPPAAAPSPAPPQPSRAAADRDEARAEKSSAEPAPSEPRAENACETACKAFSSLSRAKDAVCRLDTEGGQRCERAKKIREDAAQRVAGCGCS